MGRGTSDIVGNSLLYGAVGRHRGGPLSAETNLQRLLGELNGAGRRKVLGRLVAGRTPSGLDGPVDQLSDEYAAWLDSRLTDSSPGLRGEASTSPSTEIDQELAELLDETRSVLTGLGAWIEEERVRSLLETYIAADIWNGPGFETLRDAEGGAGKIERFHRELAKEASALALFQLRGPAPLDTAQFTFLARGYVRHLSPSWHAERCGPHST